MRDDDVRKFDRDAIVSPAPVENRVYLKAMRHCLSMHRARSTDHSETALLMALHRAGYSAALIAQNYESLLDEKSTLR